MSALPMKARVAVVTGASRGAGKGIALALGAAGLTVYVTGRSLSEGDAAPPGTVQATAEAVTRAGGQGVAAACDHADDAQAAARMMAAQRSGLIVHTSSYGSICYMHGAGKAAVDKMAHDMAIDLRPQGMAVISLWMGLLRTERTERALRDPEMARKYAASVAHMESPQFPGRAIVE